MKTGTALSRGSGLMLLFLSSCGEPSSPGPSETASSANAATAAPQSAMTSAAQTIASTPCGSEKVARFIGAMATPAVRKTIAALAGRAPVRWIAPGQAITLDFNSARLNVLLDEANKIAATRCG